MVDTAALTPYLDTVLREATVPGLPNHYRGKVRDNYDLPDGRRIIVASDRLSAFDRILTAIPLKGQVLTQLARFWFDTTADVCRNHVLDYPDPNVLVCRRLAILPVEIVVRDYLAGTTGTSIWPMYKAGRREMYGHRFPDGMRENEKLARTILTPTTKSEDHDAPLAAAEIVERGLMTAAQWERASALALALFARGRDIAGRHGLILVDTKYELGLDQAGDIVLADEIHTPDSSRYWFADSYEARVAAGERPESFDKDFVRSWVTARCDPYKDPIPEIPREMRMKTAAVYIDAFERITGKRFEWPDPALTPAERIGKALRAYLKA
jgi:phosphoribosylaminoimidazole-succinocarboxamide synthase